MGYRESEGPTARDLVKNKKVTRPGRRRGERQRGAGRPADDRERLLADPGHAGTAHRRLAERGARSTPCIVKDPELRKEPVESIMQQAFRFVDIDTPVRAAGADDHAASTRRCWCATSRPTRPTSSPGTTCSRRSELVLSRESSYRQACPRLDRGDAKEPPTREAAKARRRGVACLNVPGARRMQSGRARPAIAPRRRRSGAESRTRGSCRCRSAARS